MSQFRVVSHDADDVILYEDGRFLARTRSRENADRIVAALQAPGAASPEARIAELSAALEAQRDAEVRMVENARPYSALRRYHEGRSEVFTAVLAALSATAPAGRGAGAGEPAIPPLASYPAGLEITEVRHGQPLPPETDPA